MAASIFGSAACGSDAVPSITAVRDSAGISIAESDLRGATLSPFAQIGELELTIGVLDGAPEYTLSNVVAARTLPGGQIAVADGQASTVRIYDSSGTYVSSIGGEGGGPGEFGRLTALAAVDAEAVWTWDDRNQRVSGFALDGSLLEESTIATEARDRSMEVVRLRDGTLVTKGRWRDPTWTGLETHDTTLFVDSVVVRRIRADGTPIDTLGLLRDSERYEASQRTPNGGFRTQRAPRLFGPSAFVRAWDDVVVAGWNGALELRRWDAGRLTSITRAATEPVPIGESDVEDLLQFWVDRDGIDITPTLRNQMMQFPPSETAPVFTALVLDGPGRLWLRRFSFPWAPTNDWIVLAPDGEVLGSMQLPVGLELHEIGEDYLLGVETDDFDVPYVVRYALARDGP